MAVEGQRTDLANAGAKYDGEKVQWDLVPDDAVEEVAKVYTLGAKKYASRNWEKGISYMRIVGALRRHLNAWIRGERYDPENGQPHLASVVWNGLALLAYELRGMNDGPFDDRPRAQFYRNDSRGAVAAPEGTSGKAQGTDGGAQAKLSVGLLPSTVDRSDGVDASRNGLAQARAVALELVRTGR